MVGNNFFFSLKVFLFHDFITQNKKNLFYLEFIFIFVFFQADNKRNNMNNINKYKHLFINFTINKIKLNKKRQKKNY